MRTRVVLIFAAVLMLVIGGSAIASNMGFKISIPLTAGGATNWVSLPYYNSYINAASIFNDVPNCVQVSRWDIPSNAYQNWTGARGNDFTIIPGEAYLIKVSANGNWTVVGAHNPSLGLSLSAGGATNWVSIPYHTTATNAATLFSQIPNCVQVSRWDIPTNAFQNWTGSRGNDFNLTPGEGVLVKVSTLTTWTPAHY